MADSIYDFNTTIKFSVQYPDEVEAKELQEALKSGSLTALNAALKSGDVKVHAFYSKSQKSPDKALAPGYFEYALSYDDYYKSYTLYVTRKDGGSIYPRYDYETDQPFEWTERLQEVLYELDCSEEDEASWSIPVDTPEEFRKLMEPYPDFVYSKSLEEEAEGWR